MDVGHGSSTVLKKVPYLVLCMKLLNISGDMCLCGNTAPAAANPALALEPSKCTLPCDGNAAQTCGSETHVQLYDAIKPVTSSLAVSKSIVTVGEAVTFSPNVETSGVGWQIRMDYADGAGFSNYDPSPGTNLLTRTFYQAGKYSVGAYLTDSEQKLAVSSQYPIRNC